MDPFLDVFLAVTALFWAQNIILQMQDTDGYSTYFV